MILGNKTKLFVFDIETIPDIETSRKFLNLDENKSEHDIYQAIRKYHTDLRGDESKDFLRHPFHKVVAISYLVANIDHHDGYEKYTISQIKSGGTMESTEEELVSSFFQFFNKYKPRLVSFNGKSFDMPVLKYRAMKYGINHEEVNREKFGYNYKFSNEHHYDLYEVMSDYGSSAKCKLSEISAMLDVPCKVSASGDGVYEMYKKGEIEDIRKYCETDVLCTFAVYLKHSLSTGVLSKSTYKKSIESLHDLILKNQEDGINIEHLQGFI